MQQQILPSQQIQQLTQKLSQALVERHEIETRREELDKTILALRNVLAGIGLGQQLQTEINTQKPAEQPAERPHQ